MKIQNNGSSGAAPLESTRTQLTPSNGAGNAGNSIAGHDGDSVAISSLSAQVADANSVDTQQRVDRVAQLAALHARGSYQVSAQDLSGAMISGALGTGGGEA